MPVRAACLSAVCLFVVTPVPRARAQAAPPVPAVYAEARAERGGDALAKIHSLHIVFVVDRVGVGRLKGPGGALPSGIDQDRPHAIEQLWIAPPGRFLETISMAGNGLGGRRDGLDGDRVIGPLPGFSLHRVFMRFALGLMLVDPAELNATLTDLGPATVDGRAYSVVPYTIEQDVAGSRTQIWHVSKVELNPKGLDKAFR